MRHLFKIDNLGERLQSKSRGRLSCMLVLPSWESGCVRTLAMCFAGVVFVVKAAVVIAVVLAAVV